MLAIVMLAKHHLREGGYVWHQLVGLTVRGIIQKL